MEIWKDYAHQWIEFGLLVNTFQRRLGRLAVLTTQEKEHQRKF